MSLVVFQLEYTLEKNKQKAANAAFCFSYQL